jgi:hypothetical protein
MKYELWYTNTAKETYRIDYNGMHISTVPPDSQSKNGYHLVVKETTKEDVNQTYVDECFRQLKEKLAGHHSLAVHKIIESLENLWKSGSHPVLKTDLPKPSEQEVLASAPVVPKTPQELCNLLTCLSKSRLGIIVDQLQDAGYVTRLKSQSLYLRLSSLAQECDNILPMLPGSPEHPPHQVTSEEASRKQIGG